MEQLQVVVGVWSSFNFPFFNYLSKPEKWKHFYYVISVGGEKKICGNGKHFHPIFLFHRCLESSVAELEPLLVQYYQMSCS